MRISKDENPDYFDKLFGDIGKYEQWAPFFYPEFVTKYSRIKGVVAGVMTPCLVNVNDILDDEFETWLESKDIFLHDIGVLIIPITICKYEIFFFMLV